MRLVFGSAGTSIGGCFTGSCLNGGGVQLSLLFNVFNSGAYNGWNIASAGSQIPLTSPWVIINGQTRPMLAMEYSTTITNAHQLQLMAVDPDQNYTLANNITLN